MCKLCKSNSYHKIEVQLAGETRHVKEVKELCDKCLDPKDIQVVTAQGGLHHLIRSFCSILTSSSVQTGFACN